MAPCALLLASEDAARRFGLTPKARVVAAAVAGVAPRIMGFGPAPATRKVLATGRTDLADIDVIELNEAFAAQALAVTRDLGLPDDAPHVNPNGGAIALGHPLGASGARLVTTALYQLQRTGGRYALCTMCIGVGQGIAMIIERCLTARPDVEEQDNPPKNWAQAPATASTTAARSPTLYPPYASTVKRSPTQPLLLIRRRCRKSPARCSATTDHGQRLRPDQAACGDPIGERIVVRARADGNARPVANTLVEIWQANAAGRYPHQRDHHNAPTDPNFTGGGRTMTDSEGRYRFVTIRPGEYPWRNHYNAWRPAHIHFSLFGPAFVTRLVTQMYFPGDPLLEYDPMYMGIPDERARRRLISVFDWESTIPEQALGYKFDIVLRGRDETPMEQLPSRLTERVQ